MSKKVVFLSGTRADFGKIKSLIDITILSGFEVHIFVTGMHMHKEFGGTIDEIRKNGYKNIFPFINQSSEETMDLTLANTIEGMSRFCLELNPDLIIIHGDRVEALAGAIVGAMNNILVGHIEGGEVSGTIDELIRHSVSKMSHAHFVANETAKNRLIQMGEEEKSIFSIGSPDVDIMLSENLESLQFVLDYYGINFQEYGIVLFHPVTTEAKKFKEFSQALVKSLIESEHNYIVVFPNNDLGSSNIIAAYEQLKKNQRFALFPSLRFEYFLVLLKYAKFIVGNSSAGIREAPYYGVPAVNIGSRQNRRTTDNSIINTSHDSVEILRGIRKANTIKILPKTPFGQGGSDRRFLEILNSEPFWNISKQKHFKDLSF